MRGSLPFFFSVFCHFFIFPFFFFRFFFSSFFFHFPPLSVKHCFFLHFLKGTILGERRRRKKKEGEEELRRKKNAPTETGPLPQSHAQELFVIRVRGKTLTLAYQRGETQ